MNNLNPKILIVDDDNFIRGTYAALFQKADFEVWEASDGAEAYGMIQKNAPDIIFTGIIMPNMGGFELMEKLQKEDKYKNIPVVISSHRGKEEDKQKAYALGADDFIVSGFVSPIEAVKKISGILKRSHSYFLNIDKLSPDFGKLKNNYPELFKEDKPVVIQLTPKKGGGFEMEIK